MCLLKTELAQITNFSEIPSILSLWFQWGVRVILFSLQNVPKQRSFGLNMVDAILQNASIYSKEINLMARLLKEDSKDEWICPKERLNDLNYQTGISLLPKSPAYKLGQSGPAGKNLQRPKPNQKKIREGMGFLCIVISLVLTSTQTKWAIHKKRPAR